MSDTPTLLIRSEKLFHAKATFASLKRGNKWPTDIDGLYDDGGKRFILMEAKFGDTKMNPGQVEAFEKLSDSSRVPLFILLGSHQSDGDYDLGEFLLTDIYIPGTKEWFGPRVVGEKIKDVFDDILAGKLD